MSDPFLPTGSDHEANFDQKVHGKVFGLEGRFNDTSTVKIEKGPNGYYWHVKRLPNPPQATPASGDAIGLLTAVYDNYIVLTDLVSGATIRAAKMYHLRNNIPSEITLDGTKWTFTYTGAALQYQARGKTPAVTGGIIEYQRVTKVYSIANGTTPADQISYQQMPASYAAIVNIKTIAADAGIATGTLVTYLEKGPWRMWAKKLDQTTP